VPVASVEFDGLDVYAYFGDGKKQVSTTELNSSSFSNVVLIVDQSLDQYQVFIDDLVTPVAVGSLMNKVAGAFTAVQMLHASGTVEYDYIMTYGNTGIERDLSGGKETWKSMLDKCTSVSDRDFDKVPVGKLSATARYAKLAEACAVKYNGRASALCTYADLKDAVMYNPLCFSDAFNYCVSVTYPGFGGDLTSNVSAGPVSAGMDATSVCTMTLGLSVGTDKIFVPTMSIFGNLFKEHWIMFSLAIVALIVLAILASPISGVKGFGRR
jgi:hypothetical protein